MVEAVAVLKADPVWADNPEVARVDPAWADKPEAARVDLVDKLPAAGVVDRGKQSLKKWNSGGSSFH